MPRSTSLRSLGKQLNLSATTISHALHDDPRVKPATKIRVLLAAKAAGYRINPAVNSIMSAMRRSSQQNFLGALMAINYSDAARPEMVPYHKEVLHGATARAKELGYALEHYWVGEKSVSLKRLNSILLARSVRGLVIMPFAGTKDFSPLDWTKLAAVVMDYCLSQPTLHTVLPDHHLSLLNAMDRLREAGYRRPGLVMEAQRDVRLKHKWSAGYSSSFRGQKIKPPVPLLLETPITRELFLRWFKRHKPDVVIGHLQREIIKWLADANVRIPDDVGFLQLNWTERSSACAGIDQQPALLGSAAVEAVVAQINRNENGVPANPKTITIGGRWVDGPTLKETAISQRNTRMSVECG